MEKGGGREEGGVLLYENSPWGKKALSPAASAVMCQPHAAGRRERTAAPRLDPLVAEEEELV